MQTNKLLRTNILVSIILLIGFALTAVFSYKANYTDSLDNVEQVSSLTAEGIYYQITAMFAKPVNTSITMAHDSLLANHLLAEPKDTAESDYIETTKDYLNSYQKKYGFDSVFLVSTATGRYYNFKGLDRILLEENPENAWYFDFLNSEKEYNLNVDNDEVDGAENEITVFINCKVIDGAGQTIGVVGVGIRMNQLKELLQGYEEKFGIQAYLIDTDGSIEISTSYNGYESADWFDVYGQNSIREQVMGWKEDKVNLELWGDYDSVNNEKNYIVTRYIPELSWHLLVAQNTSKIVTKMYTQIFQACIIVIIIILSVLGIITTVIRRFNKQITDLLEERQAVFRKATEDMYDNINELNLTKNCCVGKKTEEYFKSLGAENLPYNEGLKVIAEKQIKEEFQEGYISMFSPENVIREFENGNDHLWYEFMITQDNVSYYWMRIDAHIFYSVEDQSVHMFTYRKNVDGEKRKEIQAETDEMTGFLTKKATERIVKRVLEENSEKRYAFFILDIDDFKTANDQFGHIFGDFCIKKFARIIRKNFRKEDILGRIGGDEFAVIVPIPDAEWVKVKAKELVMALDTVCTENGASWKMSASIGVAITGDEKTDFKTLYHNADQALYKTKYNGKNGFTIYNQKMK